jgi:hypothetical protein
MGHSLQKRDVRAMSVLPLIATEERTSRGVSNVPKPDLESQLGLVRSEPRASGHVLNDTELSEADLLCDSVREFVLFRRFPARRTSWTIFNETSAVAPVGDFGFTAAETCHEQRTYRP